MVTSNAKRVSELMAEYIAETHQDERKAVKMVARGVTNNLLKLTPPFKTLSPHENFGEQKEIGEFAVERDLQRSFKPLQDLNVYVAPHKEGSEDKFQKALDKHDPDVMAELLTRLRYPNITPDRIREEATKPLHNELRKDGRVPKSARMWFIFNGGSYDALEEELTHAVGRGKSGWLAGAYALGIAVPDWIARHGEPGSVHDRTEAYSDPSFQCVNSVEYLAHFAGEVRLVEMALAREAGSLERQLVAKRAGLWDKKKK